MLIERHLRASTRRKHGLGPGRRHRAGSRRRARRPDFDPSPAQVRQLADTGTRIMNAVDPDGRYALQTLADQVGALRGLGNGKSSPRGTASVPKPLRIGSRSVGHLRRNDAAFPSRSTPVVSFTCLRQSRTLLVSAWAAPRH